MKIDSYNSQKLLVQSSVLILLVLYIHSFYNEAVGTEYASFVQLFMGGGGLANIAVPMFFVFSGFLFYHGTQTAKECFPKIRKRVHSLIIPYVLWNIIFVLWYVVLQNLPGIGGMINSDIIADITKGNVLENLNNIFVAPVAFQLWFLRDLIIMVLFSPLIYYWIKYTRWYGALAILLLHPWLMTLSKTFNQFGVAYFVLGGTIAMCSDLEYVTKRVCSTPVFIMSFVVWLVHATLLALQIQVAFCHWGVLSVLAGMITTWKVYDFLASKTQVIHVMSPLRPLLGYSFFVYLFHEPAFNIIKKIGVKALGTGDIALIVLFLINPIIMYFISVLVAKLLQKIMPKVYGVLVGGR
jgi:surface polysaccharide O-acyltransferase-like enzyme